KQTQTLMPTSCRRRDVRCTVKADIAARMSALCHKETHAVRQSKSAASPPRPEVGGHRFHEHARWFSGFRRTWPNASLDVYIGRREQGGNNVQRAILAQWRRPNGVRGSDISRLRGRVLLSSFRQ